MYPVRVHNTNITGVTLGVLNINAGVSAQHYNILCRLSSHTSYPTWWYYTLGSLVCHNPGFNMKYWVRGMLNVGVWTWLNWTSTSHWPKHPITDIKLITISLFVWFLWHQLAQIYIFPPFKTDQNGRASSLRIPYQMKLKWNNIQ